MCVRAPLKRALERRARVRTRDVRAHAWFAGFDWDTLEDGSATSPLFVPCTKRRKELAALDEDGGGAQQLIEKLGASDEPLDQLVFELFGTHHPKTGMN